VHGYGRRWAVEGTFSAIKRTLGEGLRSRRGDLRLREAQRKVIAYNKLLMAQLCNKADLRKQQYQSIMASFSLKHLGSPKHFVHIGISSRMHLVKRRLRNSIHHLQFSGI
jgi:hypothetical protein